MNTFINNRFMKLNPHTDKCQTITADGVRFSILSDRLLRIEIQSDNQFCDDATQSVINRNFSEVNFNSEISPGKIIISTPKVKFTYDKKLKKLTEITLEDGRKITDFKKGNLKGTCRTLDGVDGKTVLQDGIISLSGVAVFDDSDSLIITADGDIIPRKCPEKDKYYFAYGYNYKEAIKDLFNLTGNPPLIPKFTLGNWWSRYKAYTQQEYTELMQKFIDREIPVTVATIDMDWHWVDVVQRFGKDAIDKNEKKSIFELFYNVVFPGWTGYSWNTELFPDPKAFLSWLKSQGFRITMNLHPASGCKFYEDAYSDFCAHMSIDKETKQQICFDLSDKQFIDGYFRYLHHPHEKDGVDFWWIDWQQGKKSSVEGLDPLWALNHYHSVDIARDGKRPLILSRYAGIGSHRYPLGFSGDTVQTWDSLDFQPYFTANASNIGYSWWSHDIGGHCRGYRDDELYLRWIQFGVFSPIMRLHSTANEFMGKEPWMYNSFVEQSTIEFMRLRHKLIPYLYSMNRLTHTEGRCLIEPMYYENPKDTRAYDVKNEYYFGTELIVCPVTEKCNKKTGLAATEVYLPKGRYVDIFTGRIYSGNTKTKFYRDEASIPVLAKEGSIIPLSAECLSNNIDNPSTIEILICRGNNSFIMYEDDGESMRYLDGDFCETELSVKIKDDDVIFTIKAATGNKSLIPPSRCYILKFMDLAECEELKLSSENKDSLLSYQSDDKGITVRINDIPVDKDAVITVSKYIPRRNSKKELLQTELISKYKCSNSRKSAFFELYKKTSIRSVLPKELHGPLDELENMIY